MTAAPIERERDQQIICNRPVPGGVKAGFLLEIEAGPPATLPSFCMA
jgi:hypothetical protein